MEHPTRPTTQTIRPLIDSTITTTNNIPKMTSTTGNTIFKINNIQELKESFLNPVSSGTSITTERATIPYFNSVIEWCNKENLPNWLVNSCYIDERGRMIIYENIQQKSTIVNNKNTSNNNSNNNSNNRKPQVSIINKNINCAKQVLIEHIQDYSLKIINNSINECPLILLSSAQSSDGGIYIRFGDDRNSFKHLFMCLVYWGNMKPSGILQKFEIIDSQLPSFSSSSTTAKTTGCKKITCMGKLSNTEGTAWENSSVSLELQKGKLTVLLEDSQTQCDIDLTQYLANEISILDSSLCESVYENILVLKHLPCLRQLYNVPLLENNNNNINTSSIYLKFPLRIDLEKWFAHFIFFTKTPVLKTFASDSSNNLKLYHELNISIIEADLQLSSSSISGAFVEVQIWNETFAKTSKVKSALACPFWREEFAFKFDGNIDEIVLKIKQPNGLEIGSVTVPGSMLFDKKYLCKEMRLPILQPTKKNGSKASIGYLLCKIANNWNFVLPLENFNKLNSILETIDLTQLINILYSNKLTQDQQSETSSAILNILICKKRENDFLQLMIEKEIDDVIRMLVSKKKENDPSVQSAELATQHIYNGLFRGNTNLTKIIEEYFKIVGIEYLVSILKPIINEVIENNIDCEIDPTKIKNRRPTPVPSMETATEKENTERGSNKTPDQDSAFSGSQNPANDTTRERYEVLLTYISKIWTAIYTSSNDMPPLIKHQLKTLRNNLELFSAHGLDREKLDSLLINCTSSFLFLRFFCPILLNPKMFNIIENHPNETNRRTLTLLSKMLSNLSTLSPFGIKEPFMESFNGFIADHKMEVLEYFDRITGKKLDFTEKSLELSWMKCASDADYSNDECTVLCVPHLIDTHLEEAELVDILANSYFSQTISTDGSYVLFENSNGEPKTRLVGNNYNSLQTARNQGRVISPSFEIGELEFESLTDNNTHVFGQDMMELLKFKNDKSEQQNKPVLINTDEAQDELLVELETECTLLNAKKNRLVELFSNYEYVKGDPAVFLEYVMTHLYMNDTTKSITILRDCENTTAYKSLFKSLPSMENMFGKFVLYGTKSMKDSSAMGSSLGPSKTGKSTSSATGSSKNKLSRSFSKLFKRKD